MTTLPDMCYNALMSNSELLAAAEAAAFVAQLSAEAADRHDEADNALASLMVADAVTGGDAARRYELDRRWGMTIRNIGPTANGSTKRAFLIICDQCGEITTSSTRAYAKIEADDHVASHRHPVRDLR